MATTHKVMQKEITYLPVHFPMITTARAESDWSQQSKTPTNKPLPTASQLSKYRKLDGKQHMSGTPTSDAGFPYPSMHTIF